MERRRALLAAYKPSGGGGLNATLYAGDNGQLGIDVYNYLIEHGTPNEASGYDWEATEDDNLLITGEGLVNQRVTYATSDSGTLGYFSFSWTGMDSQWYIYLHPDGFLDMEYDD